MDVYTVLWVLVNFQFSIAYVADDVCYIARKIYA